MNWTFVDTVRKSQRPNQMNSMLEILISPAPNSCDPGVSEIQKKRKKFKF